MNRMSRADRREGTDAWERRRDVRSLAPASGEGADAALEVWKRRERARALLNAREPRRRKQDKDVERPSGQ